jgi:hypothetical protein
MRIIDLDGRRWRTALDFYQALLPALGAPSWHGESIDALIDSMVWGEINAVEAPYVVRIFNVEGLAQEVRDHIELASRAVEEGRADFRARKGYDVDVRVEIA